MTERSFAESAASGTHMSPCRQTRGGAPPGDPFPRRARRGCPVGGDVLGPERREDSVLGGAPRWRGPGRENEELPRMETRSAGRHGAQPHCYCSVREHGRRRDSATSSVNALSVAVKACRLTRIEDETSNSCLATSPRSPGIPTRVSRRRREDSDEMLIIGWFTAEVCLPLSPGGKTAHGFSTRFAWTQP